MAGILSYVPVVNRLLGSNPTNSEIKLPSVEIHKIELNPERPARRLKYLLKANHANYSILYHNLQYDNHNAHILISAYLLGATAEQLTQVYDKQVGELEPWKPSPAEVVEDDWRNFLGDKPYQRAFVDFFEDQLAMRYSYQWQPVVEEYLYSGKNPLINGLIGGLGHPLIHLAYAYEVDSKEIAVEGLALACVQYNFLHKYLDQSSYTRPSPFTSESPLQLLVKLSGDGRFDSVPRGSDLDNIEELFESHEDAVMEYWNAWELNNPKAQFELSQQAAVALLVATVRPGTHAYNFYLVHLLTTSNAVRILLPFVPVKCHINLVRQWWLLVLGIFILKGRPLPDPDNVSSEQKGREWTYVEKQALNSPWAADAHYVKAVRAMRDAARTWGDVQSRYLLSALTFVDNFEGWVF